MITKTIKQFFWAALLSCGMTVGMTSCVDNDDDVPMSRYSAEKMTAAEFLSDNRKDKVRFRFGNKIGILHRIDDVIV